MTKGSSQSHTAPQIAPNPDLLQSLASDPFVSVWVGASAGTGKTKVLTERVLRLLLPRPGKGFESATPPEKILCITYTKAAAAEMAQRLQKQLSDWAVKDQSALESDLEKLMGVRPNALLVSAARRLFARVVDTPGGLRIMTIHSFCQSVLQRFPIEAGLPPNFSMLGDLEPKEYMLQCLHDVMVDVEKNKDGRLAQSFRLLSANTDAESLREIMIDMAAHRSMLWRMIQEHGGTDGVISALKEKAGLPPEVTQQTLLLEANRLDPDYEAKLRAACALLLESKSANDQKGGKKMQAWLENPAKRDENFQDYVTVFLKADFTFRKSIVTKGVIKNAPEIESLLFQEAERVSRALERMKSLALIERNAALLDLMTQVLERYERRKRIERRFDYDDLIIETRKLLQERSVSAWVMYKLDGGIDHILVDEAQDTSPDQWEVIRALSEDFFSGDTARSGQQRTLFVVGDEKQSIYSFQGADPLYFEKMYDYFSDKIASIGQELRRIDLTVSFRSTRTVLQAVDNVFADDTVRAGVVMSAARAVQHDVSAKRLGHAGLVEVWPLFTKNETIVPDAWQPATTRTPATGHVAQLAQHIAQKIKNWIGNEILESANRPVRAGDVLILLQSRSALVEHLVRALKSYDVPVAGVDRLVLSDHIAVMDMMAVAQFSLLPEDELMLATVLKTPFCSLNDSDLEDLCFDRKETLWHVVQEKRPDLAQWLSGWVEAAAEAQPYGFFAELLARPCPGDSISGRRALWARLGMDILDPIDEFLNLCLSFELSHVPSLQLFADWFLKAKTQIKREQESNDFDAVRIMTVHGSKGLEAPIVILPDASRVSWKSSKAAVRYLWPQKPQDVFLWAPNQDAADAVFEKGRKDVEARNAQEYKRLMYVALTRARDRLYIAGTQNSKNIDPESWYSIISAALEKDSDTVLLPFEGQEGKNMLRLYHPQSRVVDGAPVERAVSENKALSHAVLPDWIFEPAPDEPSRPRPLAPSLAGRDETAARSPISHSNAQSYARGKIIHHMLEVLPAVAPERRAAVAKIYVESAASGFDAPERERMIEETLAVLSHPDFAPLFGPGARAEVPVVGLIGKNYAVSGQIDRLIVQEDEVLIVDYKTNRPPALAEKDVPKSYLTQMAAYRAVIQKIYPNHTVKAALLWTDVPYLLALSDKVLDDHVP